MKTNLTSNLCFSLVTAAGLLAGSGRVAAQQPPPINGVTGTVAIQGTAQQTYHGAHTIVAKTVEGIEHLFHLTRRIAAPASVNGGKDLDRAAHDSKRIS
jgi:hypothetical protein